MLDNKTLARIAEAAVQTEDKYGIPAAFTVAQCALESAWLDKSPGNNCFGIKEYKGCQGRQLLPTLEWFTAKELSAFLSSGDSRMATIYTRGGHPQIDNKNRTLYNVRDWFATFETLADCFKKHAELLTQYSIYSDSLDKYKADKDLKAYVEGVSAAYATTAAYIKQVWAIMSQKNVLDAIEVCRGGVTA